MFKYSLESRAVHNIFFIISFTYSYKQSMTAYKQWINTVIYG